MSLLSILNKNKSVLNYSTSLREHTEEWLSSILALLLDTNSTEENYLDFSKKLEHIFAMLFLEEEPHRLYFEEKLPGLQTSLIEDANAILAFDPAAKSIEEVILSYPGFQALAHFRIAKIFLQMGVPLVPRLITEIAHSATGIDIHPGATIGKRLVIDHGTGLVVGETAIIGNDVKLFHGVTLGTKTVKKHMKEEKRHPTIGNGVVVYANATILGGDTIIGENTTIGGNAVVMNSIAPNSLVTAQIEVNTKQKKHLAYV